MSEPACLYEQRNGVRCTTKTLVAHGYCQKHLKFKCIRDKLGLVDEAPLASKFITDSGNDHMSAPKRDVLPTRPSLPLPQHKPEKPFNIHDVNINRKLPSKMVAAEKAAKEKAEKKKIVRLKIGTAEEDDSDLSSLASDIDVEGIDERFKKITFMDEVQSKVEQQVHSPHPQSGSDSIPGDDSGDDSDDESESAEVMPLDPITKNVMAQKIVKTGYFGMFYMLEKKFELMSGTTEVLQSDQTIDTLLDDTAEYVNDEIIDLDAMDPFTRLAFITTITVTAQMFANYKMREYKERMALQSGNATRITIDTPLASGSGSGIINTQSMSALQIDSRYKDL